MKSNNVKEKKVFLFYIQLLIHLNLVFELFFSFQVNILKKMFLFKKTYLD